MAERTVADPGTLPDLEDLRVFHAVANHGGVNGAARALRLPRSTISRRLARLEELLLTRLFRRARNGVSLTDSGARLLEHSTTVLDNVATLLAEADGRRTRVRGRLRVTAPSDLASEHACWLEFAAAHPEVALEVDFTNRYVDVVRERYDLAVRAGRGPDATLISRRLGHYELYAVATADYIERHGHPATPAQLREHSCLLLSALSPRRGEQGPPPPHRHIVVSDSHLALAGALRGLGIAILPPSLVREHLARGALRAALPAYNPLHVPLYATYADGTRLASAPQALLEHLARWFNATEPTTEAVTTTKSAARGDRSR